SGLFLQLQLCCVFVSERIKVLFTPTICRLRCTQNRCTNYCERGNITTVYNSEQQGAQGAPSPGFRLFLCPMLCKNGGVCIQKDRCLCPPNFTGKFCHIPVSSAASTNEIEKPISSSSVVTNQGLTESEYILPLQSPQLQARGSPMVKVRVQHPPEASVKIHQVLKVGSGPTVHERSETVTWSAGLSGSRSGIILPGERAEALPPRAQATSFRGQAPPPRIQAQTIRGDFTYTETSGFKYCFREFRNGQVRTKHTHTLKNKLRCFFTGSRGRGEGHCPKGFERVNGTQCVDVNECEQPGFCQNGNCVNTRGSYSCVCRQGFLLDASHGLCISQKVISSEKDQCFRILNQGVCSLHILRNITKQICCCSRVGKAWGRKCEACPFFGSAEFKEICPAGAGYHYSPNTLKITQRVAEINDTIGPQLVSESRPQQPEAPRHTTRPQPPTHGQTAHVQYDPRQPITSEIYIVQGRHGQTQDRPPATSQPTRAQPPVIRTQTGRPSINRQTVRPLPVPATPRPSLPRPDTRVCDARPQVCGPGRCVDVPGGRHTCICNPGFILNAQAGHCQELINKYVESVRSPLKGRCNSDACFYADFSSDIDECRQVPVPCSNGRCENTLGSYRCVCRPGYRLQGNTCTGKHHQTHVNECEDSRLCPGQECVNTQGSYRCSSCRSGYTFRNGQCADVDECVRSPSLCSTGRCENTQGSYRCVCRPGFRLEDNTCRDVDECENEIQCPGQQCVNSIGSFNCVSCRPGFEIINGQCKDNTYCQILSGNCVCSQTVCRGAFNGLHTNIDECASPQTCGPQSVCVNTDGSYRCECSAGYRAAGPGRQCRDINECLEGDFCFPKGECVNMDGSYMCVCAQGYQTGINRTSCQDVDECTREGVCQDGHCANTDGSFLCHCKTGFTSNPEKTACLDVDECVDSEGAVCGSLRCENTIGSFQCLVSCQPGYSITATGECVGEFIHPQLCVCNERVKCVCFCVISDKNECVLTPRPCLGGQCENTVGSYRCVCPPGYQSNSQQNQCSGQCVLVLWYFSAEFQALCPSGRGYVTSTVGAYSYKDVDECKLFDPEVCKGGVCVNNIPGYSCYCPSGHYYNATLMECSDNDECLSKDTCPGGQCVNTQGSFYCICEPPLVLDETQRNCVNISDFSMEAKLSYCWQHVTPDLMCQSLLRGVQLTFVDCCCLYGEAWGLHCALCPRRDEPDYEVLCREVGPPPNSPRYAERFNPVPRRGEDYFPPYSPLIYPDTLPVDINYYLCSSDHYYEDYDAAPLPPYGVPNPRGERAFGTRPQPPRAEGRPFSLAPLPEDTEREEPWRAAAPFPPFTDRRVGGDPPRRVYESDCAMKLRTSYICVQSCNITVFFRL
uniref:Latent transforming growth factor beta binding protein 4 n=1 Tax=Astyanax mexicanus TaxID=7994 RepID=A0A8B9KSN7_ASTMX